MLTPAHDVLEGVEACLEQLEAALQGSSCGPGARSLRGLQVAEELRDALLPRDGEVSAEAMLRAHVAAHSLQVEEVVHPEVGPLTRAAGVSWQTTEAVDGEDVRLREVRMRLQDVVERLRARWHSPRGEAACTWMVLAEMSAPDVELWERVAQALHASTPELAGLLGRLGRSFALELVLEESWPVLTGTLSIAGVLQAHLPAGGPQLTRQVVPAAQRTARRAELDALFEGVEEQVRAGLPALLQPEASAYQAEILTDLLAPLLTQLVHSRMQQAYEAVTAEGREREYEIVVGSPARALGAPLSHDPVIAAFGATPLREGAAPGAAHLRGPRLWAELIQRRQRHSQLHGGPVAAQVAITPTPQDLSAEEHELLIGLWRESENEAPLAQILAAAQNCLR